MPGAQRPRRAGVGDGNCGFGGGSCGFGGSSSSNINSPSPNISSCYTSANGVVGVPSGSGQGNKEDAACFFDVSVPPTITARAGQTRCEKDPSEDVVTKPRELCSISICQLLKLPPPPVPDALDGWVLLDEKNSNSTTRLDGAASYEHCVVLPEQPDVASGTTVVIGSLKLLALPSPPEECCDGQLLSLHMCITADTAPETQDANYKTDVFLFPCPPRTVFRGCDTCIEFMSRTDMVDGGEHRINDGVSSLALLLGPDDMQCVVSHLNEWNCTVKWTASKEAHCAAQGMESAGCAIAGAIRTIVGGGVEEGNLLG